MQKGIEKMTEQAKAARRAYKREWQRNNPDKVRAQQERYWMKKVLQALQEEAEHKQDQERPAEA